VAHREWGQIHLEGEVMLIEIVDMPAYRGTLNVAVEPGQWRVLSASLEVFPKKTVVTVEIVPKEDYGEDEQTSMVFGRGQSDGLGALQKSGIPGSQDTVTLHGNYRGPSEF